MAGKQAKILSGANIDDLLLYAETNQTIGSQQSDGAAIGKGRSPCR
jgi:hypothetical protein